MYFVGICMKIKTTSATFVSYFSCASNKSPKYFACSYNDNRWTSYLTDLKSLFAHKYVLNVLNVCVFDTLRMQRLFYLEYSHTKI